MKLTVYYPDGSNVVYTKGSSGVTDITFNADKTAATIKYDTPDKQITVVNFPMIITSVA